MASLWIEPQLESLLSLASSFDAQLHNSVREDLEVGSDNGHACFDVAEHITGVAFVVCQTYIAVVCGSVGVDKGVAIRKGPQHAGGLSKAQIIIHAANYWKHNSEWVLTASDRRRELIEKAFDSVGFPTDSDYPLSGVLAELSAPHLASFAVVSDVLREWKSAVLSNA